MFTKITDHADRALARLLTQFRTSAEVKGVTNALSSEVQALENAIFEVYEVIRDLTTAEGATLDKIGKLVGASPRGSLNDTNYRKRVRVQSLVNKSSGTAADLVAIAKTFHPEWDDTVKTREGGSTVPENRISGDPTGQIQSNGSVEICITPDYVASNIDAGEARELARYLKTAAVGGVRPILKYRSNEIAEGELFRLDDPDGLLAETGAGLGVGKLMNSLDH